MGLLSTFVETYCITNMVLLSLVYISNCFFSWDLAKIPNMEIALGCITTIFGSRAAQRIAILMNLYGLKLNQDKVLQASIFLKPKARMISLRYVSKYHKFCIEDSTEGELFFDVKKLMTRGDLTPILFGTKVIFKYISVDSREGVTWWSWWWRHTVGDWERRR